MAEYEILLSDLETQKAQLELERGYRITKKDLLAFIEELLKGDVNDKEYQKQIINHLVSQVFVSDDDTVVFFNLRGGKDIEKLTIDDTKEAVNSAKGVRTQTSPLHQVKPKLNRLWFDLGFLYNLTKKFSCKKDFDDFCRIYIIESKISILHKEKKYGNY